MNINEIKQELLQYVPSHLSSAKQFKMPFIMIDSALTTVKKETNMDIHELEYKNIQVYKVICYVECLLNHMSLKYDIPKYEDGTTDLYAIYDDFYEVYNMFRDVEGFNIDVYESLLQQEINLAEKTHIQLGLLENKIITILDRVTTQVEKISEIATDEKKLAKWLKLFDKNMKNLNLKELFGKKESDTTEIK